MTKEDAAYNLIQAVSDLHGLSIEEVLGDSQERMITAARKEAIQHVERLGFSSLRLAEMFHKDHTTILHHLGRTKQSKLRRAAAERRAGRTA